jgi:DNA mismatch repair protein MutS
VDLKIRESIDFIINKIENSFIIETMNMFSMSNISKNFIKPDISTEIQSFESQLSESYKKIMGPVIGIEKIFAGDSIVEILNYLKNYHSLESPREYKGSNVSILFNDTEGFSIEITNKRYESYKNEIEDFFSKYFEGNYTQKNLKSSIKFYFKELATLSDEIVLQETKLINACKKVFSEICNELVESKETINTVITYVSQLDFYLNNATLFEKFAYSIPEIIETDSSFVEAVDLRHAIVERINDNEIYIPNDIFLGKKEYLSEDVNSSTIFQDEKDCVNGLLLYGLNSSGKSTLSKSLGIAVILAQSGFFVPSKRFRFSLFESLFTRITGEDDIYNGKSTFAIELIDLKNIFNRANGRTLIIGDEPSKGTESISALAIVSSTIKHLSDRNALFIFATHMHDLRTVNEVSEIDTVVDVHLSVHYEEERDTLIYNRKLSSGSGSSIYGLEFAKYLKLNKEFLATAYSIRKRIATDLDPIEALSRNKQSTYNRGVFVQECAMCGEQGFEIHHINEQQLANDKGVIEHFHKNHKANLVCLCEKHHDLVHSGKIIIEGIKQTSNGPQLIWFEK